MMRKMFLILPALVILAGCSSGAPVAVTYKGHSLNGVGQSSPDMTNFSFTVSDYAVACTGNYDMRAAFAPEFTFPISCSDGRTGRVEAYRESRPIDKLGVDYPVRGKVTFSDGAIGMFNLGADARGLTEASLVYQSFTEGLNQPKFK